MMAEMRAAMAESVEVRQESIVVPAPIVNVSPAQVTVNVEPTPVTVNVPPTEMTVNVPPADVTVNVEPTPVTMNVPAAEVTVNVPTQAPPIVYHQPPAPGDESITFTRDPSGRIVGAKKVAN
jgi:hypothetical protein